VEMIRDAVRVGTHLHRTPRAPAFAPLIHQDLGSADPSLSPTRPSSLRMTGQGVLRRALPLRGFAGSAF
jgi:hypothetical protein